MIQPMGLFPSRWSVMSGVCLWCNTENGSLTKGPFKVLLSAMNTAHWSQCGKLRSALYSHRLPVTTLKTHLLYLDPQECIPISSEIPNIIKQESIREKIERENIKICKNKKRIKNLFAWIENY